MAYLKSRNIAVRGISAAVPANVVEIRDFYRPEWGNVEDFISSTKVERLRKSAPGQTSSDLCVAAAEKLIAELGWDKGSIDVLIFVSQTPDYYFSPATACHIQERLKLSKDCMAFDVNLGCSGWVYGLNILGSILNGGGKRGLLLVGDTTSKTTNPSDSSTTPLFGDAGTATALEYIDSPDESIEFALFTDGSGYDAIISRVGGFRTPVTPESFPGRTTEDGHFYAPFTGEMDGMSVFTFAISKAPKAINGLIEHFNIDKSKINILTLHQANLLINERIIKKTKFEDVFQPQSLKDFGNTSGTSIPLSLVVSAKKKLEESHNDIIACGYGVGLSWGAVHFRTDKIAVPELIEL